MCDFMMLCLFFFFKQKPAYEMRISYWSSDVCSSDLKGIFMTRPNSILAALHGNEEGHATPAIATVIGSAGAILLGIGAANDSGGLAIDRKSVVEGKRVSVRVDIGGRRIIIKKKTT